MPGPCGSNQVQACGRILGPSAERRRLIMCEGERRRGENKGRESRTHHHSRIGARGPGPPLTPGLVVGAGRRNASLSARRLRAGPSVSGAVLHGPARRGASIRAQLGMRFEAPQAKGGGASARPSQSSCQMPGFVAVGKATKKAEPVSGSGQEVSKHSFIESGLWL
jgi:hypothetical protein